MKIAIVGFGNMGKLYAQIIVNSISNNDTLYISNRTYQKMEDFKAHNPQVEITDDYTKAIDNAEIVLFCVTPKSSYDVLQIIKNKLLKEAILVSFISDLSIDTIATQYTGKIIRLVPTITSYIEYGITLLSKNEKVTDSDVSLLSSILGNKIKFSNVEDNDINKYSIISSCGPGIISSIINELVLSFSNTENLDNNKVTTIVNETIIATCLYAERFNKSYSQIVQEVATKGGITETGVSVVSSKIPIVFNEMIEEMKMKHKTRTEMINRIYSEKII